MGEDAYFARVDGMCIADGVGGWARSGRGGADAGRWSRLLTHFCEVELGSWSAGRGVYAVDTGSSSSESNGKWSDAAWKNAQDQRVTKGKKKAVDPVEIMQRGFENCLSCFTSEVSLKPPDEGALTNIREFTARPPASLLSLTNPH